MVKGKQAENLPDLKPGEVKAVDEGKTDPTSTDVRVVDTLSGMVDDGFMFFTPALITTHGLFDRDPVMEYLKHNPRVDKGSSPFVVDCERAFFSGLGYGVLDNKFIDWDRRLYGIHKELWPNLHAFLTGIGICNRETYYFARIGWHPLTIVDQTAMASGRILSEIPTIGITVFCISSNRAFAYIEPAKDPPRTLPYLQLRGPEQKIQQEARKFLGPPPKEGTNGDADCGTPA